MKALIEGVQRFQDQVFPSMRERFAALADGQEPGVIFITCSDSRIDPHLLTQAVPGELFVIRNAGNILPPYPSPTGGGASASLEFALSGLPIGHIVVCGHSGCGAMSALCNPDLVRGLPAVQSWLTHAEPAIRRVQQTHPHLQGEDRLAEVIPQNVRLQLEHLASYPFVSERLSAGTLDLHGWIYDIPSGQVMVLEAETGKFVPLRRAGESA
jgi:carbonic anhydrase